MSIKQRCPKPGDLIWKHETVHVYIGEKGTQANRYLGMLQHGMALMVLKHDGDGFIIISKLGLVGSTDIIC